MQTVLQELHGLWPSCVTGTLSPQTLMGQLLTKTALWNMAIWHIVKLPSMLYPLLYPALPVAPILGKSMSLPLVISLSNLFFLRRTQPGDASGLQLALHSGLNPGGALG